MRPTLKAILTVAVALVLSVSAYAQPRPGGGGGGGSAGGVITTINAQELAQLFNAAGFQSRAINNGGAQMVQSVFWSQDIFSGGIPEVCEKGGGNCRAFKIFANLGKASVGKAWVDAWNNQWLFVRAYFSKNGSLIFAWDIGLLTGVTPQYIVASVKTFKAIVDASTNFKP